MPVEYKSPHKEISFEEESGIVKQEWLDTSGLTDELLKSELKEYVKVVEKYQPKGLLSDGRHFDYTIAPELQDWIGREVIGKFIALGVKKYAQIIPEELFSQISVEQTLTDSSTGEFVSQYFPDEDSAREWLLES